MNHPPATRKYDPESSHLAEEEVTESGKREKQYRTVMSAISETPGYTAVELSRRHNLDRYMVSRRTADLCHKGMITRGAPRRCTVNKRSMVTWWPV